MRFVDRKSPEDWYQVFSDVDNRRLDLRHLEACREAARDAVLIYNVAADMGCMGFIQDSKALCMLSVLINTNLH